MLHRAFRYLDDKLKIENSSELTYKLTKWKSSNESEEESIEDALLILRLNETSQLQRYSVFLNKTTEL